MQIYENRFAYGTVRRCVRWEMYWWISSSDSIICWIVWGWFFKIRIISISRMHAAGDFILVYHIWFIMYDIVLWVRVGFLHKMTGIYVDFEAIGKYAGSHVPNKKSTIYMHRGIIITKSTHFDYHLRISDGRCWLKDWYWVHYWPWAIDACRDPWRWKRPWWIGKRERVIRVKMER